jgi:Kef-type K+ transport system membrane component KefB
VGITAQVLSDKGLLQEVSSRIILAAAVIDDVLGLLVLAVVSSLSRGNLDVPQLATTALLAAAFTVIVAKWGTHAMQRLLPPMERGLRLAEAQFAIAMAVLFALAALAVWIGVAAIVGAFLAGMALSESTGPRVEHLSNGVAELLVPFFLAGIGLHLELQALSNWPTMLLALAVLVAAVISKFVGCGLGALRLGKAEALRIGIGMMPRGEVGMVVAQIGLGLGIIHQNTYGVVVFMSVVTTMLAPALLKIAYRGVHPRAADEESYRIE